MLFRSLMCPSPIVSGEQGFCTCSTNQGLGAQVCFEITSGSTLTILPTPPPNCDVTNSGGEAQVIVEADLMGGMSPQVNLVQCCLSGGDNTCGGADPNDDASVTVVPTPTPMPTPTPTPP